VSKDSLDISFGRAAFGDDPAAYHAARPAYPEALWDRLGERCGLGPGTAVFEVGPGAGAATERLLTAGADLVLAIEPDRRMAAFLEQRLGSPALDVLIAPFESAVLPKAFDLGVSATAFHWVEQRSGLAKAARGLKSGAWWAMWWTNFGDEDAPDPFHLATRHLFAETPRTPAHGTKGGRSFATDRAARLSDLASAGFVAGEVDFWPWNQALETAHLIALYATFSPIIAMAAPARARLLDGLAEIAERDFGGVVERPFSTILYTARRPQA
jgi:hypothetical protein